MKKTNLIISGGQTGCDGASLDFAINKGYEYSGCIPKWGKAENGKD